MKIKRAVLIILLIKIILTLRADDCKKNEPGINNEIITGSVQKGPWVNGTSISSCDFALIPKATCLHSSR